MPRVVLSLLVITIAIAVRPEPSSGQARGQQPESAAPAAAFRMPIALVPRASGSSDASPAAGTLPASALALPPRKAAAERTRATSPARALVTTATSLGVVSGLFLLLIWFQRRTSVGRSAFLPGEVVQTLGRVPLAGRQEMHLVRVGNKLLLLAVTANSAETLTEITDPAEIARLSGICQQNEPGSISASFREILGQLQRQPSRDALQYASGR